MTSISLIDNNIHFAPYNQEQTIWRMYSNSTDFFRIIRDLANVRLNIRESWEDIPYSRTGVESQYNQHIYIDANLNQIDNLIRIINEIDNNITEREPETLISIWHPYYMNNVLPQRQHRESELRVAIVTGKQIGRAHV